MPHDAQESSQSLDARRTTPRRIGPLLTTTLILLLSVSVVGIALGYYGTDGNLRVGYGPRQPIEFNHLLHAGDLGLDCRFCHTGAEQGTYARLPSTALCMSCHDKILPESIKLLPVRAAFAANQPIEWVRVTKLPEFTYFHHGIHVKAGVVCSTCHGNVDTMVRTEQQLPLSMGFCVDCHRNPEMYLRSSDNATVSNTHSNNALMTTQRRASTKDGRVLTPPLHCSGCHR
jgi:hypothetical protein